MANTYWVVPGRFEAGEYPGARSRKEAAGRLRILLQAGLDYFIDLTQPHEGLAPYAEIGATEASRLGTTFVHERHSIVDMDVPRSRQATAAILDAIDLRRWMTAGWSRCTVGASIGRTCADGHCWFVQRLA